MYPYLSRTFTGDYPRALAAVRAIGLARGYEFLVGDEVYRGEPEAERIRLYDAVTPFNMHGPSLCPAREVTITSFNEWHEGTQIEPDKGDEESAAMVIRGVFGE